MFKYIYFLIAFTLLISLNSCSDDQGLDPHDDHYEAYGVNLYKDGSLFMKVFNTVIQPGYPTEFDASLTDEAAVYNVIFLDEDGNEMPLPDDDDLSLDVFVAYPQIAEIEIIDADDYKFKIKPLQKGATKIEIRLLHNDHPDFKTPRITLNIK